MTPRRTRAGLSTTTVTKEVHVTVCVGPPAKVTVEPAYVRTPAPAMIDMLAGTVSVFFDSIPSSLPHVRSGKLRGIAVASSRRSPVLPEMPTMSEAGLKGFTADSWFGIMVPAGTPRDLIAKLNTDIVKGLDSTEVKEIIARQGGEVMSSTPEQMATQIRGDREKWGRVIRESGAKIE